MSQLKNRPRWRLALLAIGIIGIGLTMGSLLRAHRDEGLKLSQGLTRLQHTLQTALISQAYAQSAPTAMQTLRNNIFLVIGYPSNAVYVDLNDANDGTEDGVVNEAAPQSGLLGLMDDVMSQMATIAIANGISSCADIPSTGSYTGSATILETSAAATVTFATPTKSIPTGWTSAGTAFTKRVEMTSGSHEVAVEFLCDRDAAFATFKTPGDSISGSTRQINVYWDVEDANDSRLEMAMKVFLNSGTSCGGTDTCESWLLRAQTAASNQFQLWQSSFAWRETKYQGERVIINGDHSTGAMSAYYTFESDFGTTLAAVTGADDDATTPSPSSFDFEAQTTADLAIQGCLDFEPVTNATSTTVCSGYALSTPPTTIFVNADATDYSYTGLKDLVDNFVDP